MSTGPNPPKRRRSTSPQASSGRRALSCTECKRRKTKCSALGKTPCDACVKRGRPAECVWEGVSATEATGFALASDLEALRAEVQQLRALIAGTTPPSGRATPKSRVPETASLSVSSVPPVPADTVESTVKMFEEQITGVLPGYRLKMRPLGVDASSASLLDQIYSLLPDPSTGTALVEEYLNGPFHRGWHIIDGPTFRRENLEFASQPDRRLSNTDPAWLAVFLMVLAITTKFSPNAATLFPFFLSSDLAQLPMAYYKTSLMALEAADYLAVPQIRHIQVSLAYVQFLFHFGETPAQVNIALRHLESAITTAQWLNLDILNDDPTAVPLDDPAFSGFTPRAALGMCKRYLHILSFMDGTMQRQPRLWRLDKATTQMPENLRNLDDTEARPSYELTEATLARVGGTLSMVITHHHKPGELSYDEVLEYDRALRLALGAVPPVTEPLEDTWLIHLVFCSIHNRILRVHRPFMTRGYHEEEWQVSRKASVDSAMRIIERQALFNQTPWLRSGFAKRWILGAAMVLAIDFVLGNPSSRDGLSQALAIFTTEDLRDQTPHVTRECAKTIGALMTVGDERSILGTANDLDAYFDEVKQSIAAPALEMSFDFLFPDLSAFDFAFVSGG